MNQTITSGNVQLPNGETLNVHVTGTGPDVLLMIHGMWLDHRSLEPLFPYLQERFTMIVPDFRGHGKSSYVNPINSVDDLVEDLSYLLQHFQVKKLYFLGWCGGSVIALKYAAKYPDNIVKIIIVCPPGLEGLPLWKSGPDRNSRVPIETKEELIHHTSLQLLIKAHKDQNKEAMKLILDRVNFNTKKPAPEILESLVEQTLQANNIEDLAWSAYTCNLSEHKKWITEGTGEALKAKVNILLIYGEDDNMIPRHAIDQYFEYLGDRITLKLVEDGGHAAHLLYPKEVSEDILKFCASV